MTQRSMFWDGTTGDCGPYDATELMDYCFRAITGSDGNLGVLYGWGGELEVTHTAGTTVSIASGAAMVHGGFYENTAATTLTGLANNNYVIVRRTWAGDGAPVVIDAHSARLTFEAALTQDATLATHYDIPLARVTVAAGVITAVTDLREFCQFNFWPGEGSIWAEDDLADGTLGVSELENQTRWRFHGAGTLKQDTANYPLFALKDWAPGDTDYGVVTIGGYTYPYWAPSNIGWRLNASELDILWLTEQVPEDIASATLNIYVWNTPAVDEPGASIPVQSTGNALWGYEAWVGGNGTPQDYHTDTTAVSNANRLETSSLGTIAALSLYRDLIGSIPVSAGEIVHLKVYRDGTDALDTCNFSTRLHGVELSYEADS